MTLSADTIIRIAAERYVGDGLYAKIDGDVFTMRLRAPRTDGDHLVFISPEILIEILRLAREAQWPCA